MRIGPRNATRSAATQRSIRVALSEIHLHQTRSRPMSAQSPGMRGVSVPDGSLSLANLKPLSRRRSCGPARPVGVTTHRRSPTSPPREDRCQAIHETQRQTATALTINDPAENATVDRTKVNRVTVISDAARVRCPFAIRARGVHANCTSGSENAARPSPIAGRATPPPYRA